MKTNQELKNAALTALKGKWAPSVLATLVILASMIVPIVLAVCLEIALDPNLESESASVWSTLALYVFMFLLYYPLSMVGYYNAFKDLLRDGNDKVVSNMFTGTFKKYPRALGLSFLYMLFVALWSMLLYIPGIIKALAYSLSPYILKDHPELSPNQALNLSIKMMKGHKFDLFCLILSFFGWAFLAVFTLGVGYLWFAPYMSTAMAAFYEDVKAEYEGRQQIAA
jgi:uncharacterized membrane protein